MNLQSAGDSDLVGFVGGAKAVPAARVRAIPQTHPVPASVVARCIDPQDAIPHKLAHLLTQSSRAVARTAQRPTRRKRNHVNFLGQQPVYGVAPLHLCAGVDQIELRGGGHIVNYFGASGAVLSGRVPPKIQFGAIADKGFGNHAGWQLALVYTVGVAKKAHIQHTHFDALTAETGSRPRMSQGKGHSFAARERQRLPGTANKEQARCIGQVRQSF